MKAKDERFLDGLASDKKYLEDIIKQLSNTNPRNRPKSLTTQSMLSEVIECFWLYRF